MYTAHARLVHESHIVAMALTNAQFRIEEDYLERLKGMSAKRGVTLSEFLREFVTDALERDAAQDVADELARLGDESRDLRHEIQQLRNNLSIVLELVLRNAPAEKEQIDSVLKEIKERGLIS